MCRRSAAQEDVYLHERERSYFLAGLARLALDFQQIARFERTVRKKRIRLAQRGNGDAIRARDGIKRFARLHAMLQRVRFF